MFFIMIYTCDITDQIKLFLKKSNFKNILNNMKKIEFWYSIGSTYTYLSTQRLETVEAKNNVERIMIKIPSLTLFIMAVFVTGKFAL